jgi:hypothetical protein
MNSITQNRNRGDSGQSLVEFALVVPLLLLLVFGIIEFGRVYHAQLVVASAAREGARKAAVNGDPDTIGAAIQNAAATLNVTATEVSYPMDPISPPESGTLRYCINYPLTGSRKFGDPVEVYVQGRIDIVIPIISSFLGTTRVLPAMAVMRVESG